MAANMQHMAGAGHMMQQQMQQMHQHMRKNTNQYQTTIFQRLSSTPVPPGGWQASISINDRMGKTMELFTNVTLGSHIEPARAVEMCIGFELQAFTNAGSKEAYDSLLSGKIMEFFKKRQANSSMLQNGLNANAQVQAQVQAQAQQSQALLNMQHMGRGFPPQQGFAGMPQGMQGQPGQQMTPQQQQQQQQMLQLQQQQQRQMAAGMGMPNQAGRGMGPGQPPGMAPGQARPNIILELSRLPPGDREKVNTVALRFFNQATETAKNVARAQVRGKVPPQQLAEFTAEHRDPALLLYQTQAFHAMKNAALVRGQQGAANMNAPQAAMMQQQNSQQPVNNMMGNAQGAPAGHDFSQFAPSMESIKDQQMSGLMAQQAGQMVVPASGAARNATPQPGNQGMPVQQGQNQTTRPTQQQNQQQQMKLNQPSSQQAQAAQMKQMQSQQGGLGNAMDQNHSPAMNAGANRGPNGMNPMGPQPGQPTAPFGDQRFNPAMQRPNQGLLQAMLAGMAPEQRQQISNFSPEKLMELVRRWGLQQQQQARNMNAGQMNPTQMQHQNQLAQNMGGVAGSQPGMQPQQQQLHHPQQPQQQQPQPSTGPNGGPQQGQGTISWGSPQIQSIMDSMDIPPQVRTNIIPQLAPEIKRWRELKLWVGQNTISQQAKNSLSQLQRTQFQHWWVQRRQQQAAMAQQGQPQPPQLGQQQLQPQQQPQQGQPLGQQNMNPMMNAGVNMANMQAHMANSPPHLLQVSPHEIAQIRANRPAMANYTDDQIRLYIQQMKRQSWVNQTRMRAQSGAGQGLGPQNPMAGQTGGQMGQQQNQPPNPQQLHLQQQQQAQAANRAQLQQQPSQQPAPPMAGVTPAQAPVKQQPTPQQSAKNLKRPSTDDTADNNNVAPMNSAGTRGTAPKKPAGPTPQQIANLTPEQRAKYEMWVKTQVANKDSAAASMAPSLAPSADAISKLKAIGQEAQRQALQEPVVDYPMSQQELEETGAKLRRIVIDMGKVGRGLSKWFAITGDEGRASMFFKFRLRLVKQFVDGESMNILRDSFSMRSSDLEQARAMLESMARDLMKSTLMKAQNSQQQGGQQVSQGNNDQSPPPAVAPLNATNLEKNTQALNRQQKNASKAANQPPPAPTVAQAPGFPTNASSPHGNPNYMSRAKDMHLQIPPRKKQKVSQQPGQAASTPSPRVSKTASPEVKRATEPLKPVFLCKEADCDMPSVGFPTEQALKQHVEEEHIKPKEDPVKFVQENLALVLGLEKDGAVKSTSGDSVQAMGAAESKQGHDTAMKRSGSALSRVQSGAVRGENGTPKTGVADVTTPGSSDPWATATIDTQALLSNLGFENGLPTVMNEFQLYRSLTPNDTPESSKDSGASEPNSDISETAALEIDMNWQHLDTDLLLDLNNTSLGMESTLDPSLLLDPLAGPPPDWDDITVDFNKPFQFDTSRYSFNTL